MSRGPDSIRVRFALEGGGDLLTELTQQSNYVQILETRYAALNNEMKEVSATLATFSAFGVKAEEELSSMFVKGNRDLESYGRLLVTARNNLGQLIDEEN